MEIMEFLKLCHYQKLQKLPQMQEFVFSVQRRYSERRDKSIAG